jgi:hypothetical protein
MKNNYFYLQHDESMLLCVVPSTHQPSHIEDFASWGSYWHSEEVTMENQHFAVLRRHRKDNFFSTRFGSLCVWNQRKKNVRENRKDIVRVWFTFVYGVLKIFNIECHFREATREMKCSDGAICMSSKIRARTGSPSSLLPNVHEFLKMLASSMCMGWCVEGTTHRSI